MNETSLYVSHHTPNMAQDSILTMHIISWTSTKFPYLGGSVFNRDATSENIWNFKSEVEGGPVAPIYNIVTFQESNRSGHQNAIFYVVFGPRLPKANCVSGSEKKIHICR